MSKAPDVVYVQKYLRNINKDGTEENYWGSSFIRRDKDCIEYVPKKQIEELTMDLKKEKEKPHV